MTKRILASLVEDDISAQSAAERFNAWVISNATSRLLNVLQREQPHNLTKEEKEENFHMACFAPNPSGDVWMIIEEAGTAAMAIPPNHTGQDRLVEMLDSLRAMPPQSVPQCNGDDLTGRSCPVELWASLEEDLPIGQWLLELGRGKLLQDTKVHKRIVFLAERAQ